MDVISIFAHISYHATLAISMLISLYACLHMCSPSDFPLICYKDEAAPKIVDSDKDLSLFHLSKTM